ncbi:MULTISPECIES: helix-turn-helix transcriptional regulator [unclassified Bradyrhizobium]
MTDFKNIPEKAALSRAVPIEFVADYRGISTHEIRRLKRLGQMPAPLKTGGRRLYWRLGDIVAWVDGMAEVQAI